MHADGIEAFYPPLSLMGQAISGGTFMLSCMGITIRVLLYQNLLTMHI
jgi:hypothetical protein